MSDSSDPRQTAMQIALNLTKDVYQDGLQPSVKVFGEALAGIMKSITFYPRFWSQSNDISLDGKVQRFKHMMEAATNLIPESERILPHPNIVGPTVQALEYSIFEDDLADLFANLLSSSMDRRTSNNTHPSFVEIIKQISGDEARILKYLNNFAHSVVIHIKYHENPDDESYTYYAKNFSSLPNDAGCQNPHLGQVYLENLSRFGLVEIPVNWWYNDESKYVRLIDWFEREKANFKQGDFSKGRFSMEKSTLRLTTLGYQFVLVCVR